VPGVREDCSARRPDSLGGWQVSTLLHSCSVWGNNCCQADDLADSAPTVCLVHCRDVWWQEAVRQQSNDCPPEWVDAEDPLFLL
jgi:acyl-coenzyme A synthetase/AMP-(fatty) acid ligase